MTTICWLSFVTPCPLGSVHTPSSGRTLLPLSIKHTAYAYYRDSKAARTTPGTMLQSLQDIVLVSLFFGISWLLLSLSQRWAKSKTRLSIPRIGLDPKVVGIEACKQDFLINGYKYVQEGYKKVCCRCK